LFRQQISLEYFSKSTFRTLKVNPNAGGIAGARSQNNELIWVGGIAPIIRIVLPPERLGTSARLRENREKCAEKALVKKRGPAPAVREPGS
jgi:hypothetical protein